MSRKDSKGMFANVLGQLSNEPAAPVAVQKSTSPHLSKVAAGIRHIQERSDLADKLLKDAEHIVELDPETIKPSLIVDRFGAAYDDIAVSEIAESIRERGQIVPGLVRPIVGNEGQFQIVYGRRRLAAVKLLGLKFKAAIRELSDEQAVIIQGEENSAREDLSFIEKCSFALAQESAGFRRDIICASLSTRKSHVSEMIKIASTLPEHIRFAIGSAPEIGRPRWIDLISAWESHSDAEQISIKILKSLTSETLSNDRFLAVLSGLRKLKVTPTLRNPPKTRDIKVNGQTVATISFTSSGAKLNFEKTVSEGFVNFVADRMDQLLEAYTDHNNSSQAE